MGVAGRVPRVLERHVLLEEISDRRLVLNRKSGDLAMIRMVALREAVARRYKMGPLFPMIPVGAKPVGAAVVAGGAREPSSWRLDVILWLPESSRWRSLTRWKFMMVSLDELRRIYRSLNDEALLEMDREELTETARICFDAELTQRGIDRKTRAGCGTGLPSSEAKIEPPMPFGAECGEMVVAAVYLTREDAKLAQALLESENIPAHVADDCTDICGKGLSGLRLFVPASSLELARALLQTKVSEEDLADQAESGGRCDETNGR